MGPEPIRTEEFRVTGEAVIGKIRELVNEGNVRRIILKAEDGRTLIEIPLTVGAAVGVAAAILFPVWAAIGAIAALAAHVTIVVERVEDKPGE